MEKQSYRRQFEGLYADHYTHVIPSPDFLYTHSHSDYELLYILSGDLTYVIEDRRYKLKRHDLVVIRPNDYHFLQIDSPADYERHDILFSPEALDIRYTELIPSGLDVINCRHNPVIYDLFKKIDYYNLKLDDEIFKRAVRNMLEELVINLTLQAVPEGSACNPALSRALSYINNSLFTLGSVAEVAGRLYMTESYLYRLFRQELHTTPHKYITEKRLVAAGELLRQGKKATQVCDECGFSDYTVFYRSYKKFYGHSPSGEK